MIEILSQVAAATEYGTLVAQFGFGGGVLWILVKWLDWVKNWMTSVVTWMARIDHSQRSLSKALWMDLASRPYTDAVIKEHARQMCVRIEAKEAIK